MATGGGGRGAVLRQQLTAWLVVSPHGAPLPHRLQQPRAGLPLPGPCCCPWTGRTPWPSSPFSQSCIRMKGSRPFWVSLLHGFGRDSMSLTLPWDRPSTWNGDQRHTASAPRIRCEAAECVSDTRVAMWRRGRDGRHTGRTPGAEHGTNPWGRVATAWGGG